MEETWSTVWTEVRVSNLGNVELDIKKIQADLKKRAYKVKRYDEPTFVNVRMKQFAKAVAKKSIICLNTNQWFESLNAAGKFFKIEPRKLSRCLKGHIPDVNGLEWAYYTEQ